MFPASSSMAARLAIVVLASLCGSVLCAERRDESIVRFVAFGVSSDLELSASDSQPTFFFQTDEHIELRADNARGAGVSWERRWSGGPLLGATLQRSEGDIPFRWTQMLTDRFGSEPSLRTVEGAFSTIELTTLWLDVGYHWTLGPRIAVAVSATGAWAWPDVTPRTGFMSDFAAGWVILPLFDEESGRSKAKVDEASAIGATVAVELRGPKDRVRPYLRARWLDLGLDFEAVGQQTSLDLGPLWLELGLGWSW